MDRLGEKFLALFIILVLFGVVQLHFIVKHNQIVRAPCQGNNLGVHWVRDPTNCTKYFICVSGQPIKMPGCPRGYVWSVSARNCVGRDSRWNDCPVVVVEAAPMVVKSLKSKTVRVGRISNFSATSDRMDALLNKEDPAGKYVVEIKRVYPNHPCVFSKEEVVLPHPTHCHWFYNCTLSVESDDWMYHEALTQECPYPKQFSLATRQCENYEDVDCGTRKDAKAPCDYRENVCGKSHCRPCAIRHGSCISKPDGRHPFPLREWTPRFIMCKNERTVAQKDCSEKKPIFSPESNKCEELMNVPKQFGGFQPMCSGRQDGLHPDETGRCDLYFECQNKNFTKYETCSKGASFDPRLKTCRPNDVAPPCGNDSTTLCDGFKDGLYADPYGRCPMYYHCRKGELMGYLKCPFGAFSPQTEKCEFSQDIPAPCGTLPNICENQLDGTYADMDNNCMSYYKCSRRYVVSMKACKDGLVFNHVTGECDAANNTPAPCGMGPSCFGKKNGRYPSPLRGCEYFYTCHNEMFRGYEKCTLKKGGFYFNPETEKCDFPPNICAPCGVKTENCTTEA
ncbi:uncharacterized protein LOC121376525 [Gigantopelta aegis]|uniref:uncharacterized protein LOC121376525 n=1 Tax=Gigantopelta aegis TaxID=1735272 RepID=UPI001B88BD95|nr:uncharacterized protein LOC121376525 [Gigantopelta aegis]